MKAILIDPYAETITEVEYNGDWRTIYEHIDCDTGDGIYVDDNGLITGDLTEKKFFLLDTYHQPVVGKGLVLGVDDEGESTSPQGTTVEYLKKHIKFMDYNTMSMIAQTGVWG